MFELAILSLVGLGIYVFYHILKKAQEARYLSIQEMEDLSLEDLENMPMFKVIEGEQTPGTFPDIKSALESTVIPD